MSAFWATVIRVELVNLAFSIDSILVAVAVSTKLWVVLSGGILGIVAMRLVVGQLLALIERYPALVDGAFVIIAWVGIKLLLEYLYAGGYVAFKIPTWLSLGLIVVIFAAAFVLARREERRAPSRTDDEARALLADEDGREDAQ
jgi:predicted tellurium resistance membrane protein TerC